MLTCKFCGKEIVESNDILTGYRHAVRTDFQNCNRSAEPVDLEAIEIQYRCAAISGLMAADDYKTMSNGTMLNCVDQIAKAAMEKWHRS